MRYDISRIYPTNVNLTFLDIEEGQVENKDITVVKSKCREFKFLCLLVVLVSILILLRFIK